MLKIKKILSSSPRILARALSSSANDGILTEVVNGKGVITFNRPKALNALSPHDIPRVTKVLERWLKEVSMIIMVAKGDMFCAGGDLKTASSVDEDLRRTFYREGFKSFYILANFPRPVVCLVNGPAMGAGIALAAHPAYAVVSEKVSFSLPETAIGYYPDNGATFFTSRLRSNMGYYMALTGAKITGFDAMELGLVSHVCNSSDFTSLHKELLELEDVTSNNVEVIMEKYHNKFNVPMKFSLQPLEEKINAYFGAETVEETLHHLKKDESKWAQTMYKILRAMSPTSLKVAKRALDLGTNQNLAECLHMESMLSVRMTHTHDFREGVRAILFQKDKRPSWSPETVEKVTDQMVDNLFMPATADELQSSFHTRANIAMIEAAHQQALATRI